MACNSHSRLDLYRYNRRLRRLALLQERGLMPGRVLELEKYLVECAKERLEVKL